MGCGGTVSRYAEEGKRVIVVIFANGDKSSPWLDKDTLVDERIKESTNIDRYLGVETTLFLGLPDGNITDQAAKKKVILQIAKIINEYKPKTILTHSNQDPHPDHRGVHQSVVKALDIIDKKKTINLYAFEIWNVVNETHPRIYVDVSKTFWKKIKAMKMFKSQRLYIYLLFTHVIIRAFFSGFHAKCRYAERFYKIR
ncbi:MAG TPA: hypothetical protein HA226_00205 [Nanoarchaeota archaeon]|nr:hypothetical protein [Nanoarchaeota archaeon]